MHCNQCGQELDQGSKFCIFCGNEQPLEPATLPHETPILHAKAWPTAQPIDAGTRNASKKLNRRYLLFGAGGTAIGAILLAVILFIAGVFSAGGNTTEGSGFNTPEDAAKAYLTGLRDRDIDAMLAAFAVESYVDNYDFEALAERLNTYIFTFELPFPNTNDYNRQLDIESRRNGILRQIIIQYMLYNVPDALNNGSPVIFEDPGAIADFVKDFGRNTEDYVFEDIQISAVLSSEGLSEETSWDELSENLPEYLLDDFEEDTADDLLRLYWSEANQENIERQAEVFGAEAEDVANVAMIFEADGDTWVFCPQAIRYNGRWYLQTLQGNVANLAGMSVYTGGIAPIG